VIVECQNCMTRFQLDDERIPLAGIRARCSRCKVAFFLAHPSAGSEASADPGQAPPSSEPAAPEFLADPSAASQEVSSPEDADEEDEDDWEFNDDLPIGEDDPLATSATDFDAGAGSDGEFSDANEESFAGIAAEVEATPSTEAAAGDSGTFGSVEDFGSLAEDGFADGAASAGSMPHGDISDISDVADADYADDEDSGQPLGAPGVALAGAPDSAEQTEDLGDPEDWDLLGDASPAAPSGAMAAASPRVDRAGGEAPLHMRPPGSPSELPEDAAVRTASIAPPLLDATLGTARTPWLRAGGNAVGWIVVAGALAAILSQTLLPAAPGSDVDFEIAGFRIDNVATHWTPRADGRQMLVVTGDLSNTGPAARRPGVILKVVLLDETGMSLAQPAIAAGVPLDAVIVREASAADRARARERALTDLAFSSIAAGDTATFAAYIEDPPAEARRIDLFSTELGPEQQRALLRARGAKTAVSDSGADSSTPMLRIGELATLRDSSRRP
jgi:predicted Zn finger-like uncharacterized protein